MKIDKDELKFKGEKVQTIFELSFNVHHFNLSFPESIESFLFRVFLYELLGP